MDFTILLILKLSFDFLVSINKQFFSKANVIVINAYF